MGGGRTKTLLLRAPLVAIGAQKYYSILEPLDPNSHKSEPLSKELNEPQEDAVQICGYQMKRL